MSASDETPAGITLSPIPVVPGEEYQPNSCREPPASNFPVRGANYASDKRKDPSEESAAHLIMCEMFHSETRCDNVTLWRRKHILEEAKRKGLLTDNQDPFLFTINMQLPGGPEVATYFLMKPEIIQKDAKFAKLWKRFCQGDDDFRSKKLKLIPLIVDANVIVTRCVGKKPVILGKHIPTKHFTGNNYVEIDVDITNSFVVRACTSVAKSYASELVIDMGYVLEGNEDEELPERVLGAIRYIHLDFGSQANSS
eukprot:TRINITY_DN2243_c0_g2::TRINITY_DN2243_c0_g2_i1::g.6724::m.6724 TRINITY_DN2243_c0_g2::TRINITY_DN2243_c0_g2_i1::g.6724  ORF type:complete len:254 (+),score=16.49,sp/Q8VZF6/EDR2L_ARATH/35.43/4e-35,DUF1336/PF07059.7/2e-48 TRINITY_DN2243_c0_g2_i1:168-929(+)